MEGLATQPHIHLSKQHGLPLCIIVGDPERAKQFADAIPGSKELAYNREYRSFKCTQDGISFLIVSHGVGASGCAICVKELIEIGAKCIVRGGTCGSLQSHIRSGDIVVADAAVKEDGTSALLEPNIAPALADVEVSNLLVQTARDLGVRICRGITVTSDLFYPPTLTQPTLKLWSDAKCAAVEMEASAVFVLARHAGIRAGCLCVVHGNPLHPDHADNVSTAEQVPSATIMLLNILRKSLPGLQQLALQPAYTHYSQQPLH